MITKLYDNKFPYDRYVDTNEGHCLMLILKSYELKYLKWKKKIGTWHNWKVTIWRIIVKGMEKRGKKYVLEKDCRCGITIGKIVKYIYICLRWACMISGEFYFKKKMNYRVGWSWSTICSVQPHWIYRTKIWN